MNTPSDSQSEPEDEPPAPPPSQPLGSVGLGPTQLPSQPAGCQPSLDEFFKYMDGAMDETREAAVRDHLRRCNGCDELYHLQAGFRYLLGQHCRSEPPKDLSKRIFKSIYDLG